MNERTSIEIKPEPNTYKSYSKATFNGFNRDYPISLRQILDPNEFDQIIQSVNIRTVRRKNTPFLKGTYYFGLFSFAFFIGMPIIFGCFVTHKKVYKKYFKKLKQDINEMLIQINENEICKRKGIVFSLREKCKTDHYHSNANQYSDTSTTAIDYYIVISYFRQPDLSYNQPTTINNTVNVLNNRTRSNNNNNNNNNYHKIDHSMEIPIDSPILDSKDHDKWIIKK